LRVCESASLRVMRVRESASHASHASLASQLQITPFSIVTNLFYFNSRVSEVRIGHVTNSLLVIYLTPNEDHAHQQSMTASAFHLLMDISLRLTLSDTCIRENIGFNTTLNTLSETKI